MVKVGIPKALLYYQYYPMCWTFFRELGAEVVVSPPTNQVMTTLGSSRVVADTCLPVKVFVGHVLFLVEKCDYIFIPSVRSVKSKVYNCPKFLGLPDMTRAIVPESPPILDIDVDINKGTRELFKSIDKLGRHFTRNQSKVRQAAMAAWQAHLDYQQQMYRQGLTSPQGIEAVSSDPATEPETEASHSSPILATIAVIGHPYLLYDELINHRFIQRLEQAHVRVLTPEMVCSEDRESAISRVVGKAHWTYEDEVVGAGEHYLSGSTDGVIGMVAFGCGPDSLMVDIVQRQAQLHSTPFMSLHLDEHTAEGGLVTRLEAFLDMIYRKRRQRACV